MSEVHDAKTLEPAPGSGVNRLIKQLKSRQRELWLQGKQEPAETLLKAHPEVAASPAAFSLVYGEFLLREETGSPAKLDEFKERFPGLAQQLEDQVKLHQVFGNSVWRDDTEVYDLTQMVNECPAPDIPGFTDFTLLGRGGMGLVYRARHIKLDRLVALKMMIDGQYARSEMLIRFRTEAEAVAQLDHPNIVPVYEVGEWNGLLYFTMKLVENGSLSQHLANFKNDRQAAARLVADLARALHYAHQRGILHRDLKPSNILIDHDGKPYVTDFGLAKRTDRSANITITQGCVGTPGYMAPEQAAGKRFLTVAVDVWGLGAILYELLTQKAPFANETPMQAMLEVLENDVRRPRSVDASINPDLETICLKALAREPERRYSSALALAEDLDRWGQGDPITARASRPSERLWRWVRRRPAIAGLLVAVLLTAVAGVTGITLALLYALSGWERASELGQQANVERISAEKRRDEAENQLYFSRIAQASFEEKSNQPASASYLLEQCEPDKHEQVDRRNWEWHYLQGLLHADLLTISDAHEEITFDLAFSPDGQQLVSAGGSPYRPYPPDRVRVWNVWGEQAGKAVAEFPHPRFLQQVRYLSDGRRIVWYGDDKKELHVADVLSGKVVQTISLPNGLQNIALSADGTRYVYLTGNGRYQVHELATQKLIHEFTLENTSANTIAFNLDGTILAISTKDALILHSIAKSTNLRLTSGGSGRSKTAFSSDGKLVAVGMTTGVVKIWDAVTGQQLQSLSGHDGDVRAVAFSPNGQQLATTGADHTVRLWTIKTGEEVLRFRGHQGRGMCLCFHPSGRFLASGSGQPSEIKVWDLTRQQEYLNVKPPAGKRIEALSFSSDGNLVHTLRATGPLQSTDASTGSEQSASKIEFTGKPIRPAVIAAFSSDASLLAALSESSDKVVDIVSMNDQKVLHQLEHNSEVKNLGFSKNGSRLVTSSPAQRQGESREIRVWDTTTGKLVSLTKCDPFVESRTYGTVALNADGTLLAHEEYQKAARENGNPDRTCQFVIRDAMSGEEVHRLSGVLPRVERIAFNHDGSLIALSCEKRGVVVYDLLHKKWLHQEPLQGSSNRTSLETFWDLSFSPDGQRLAGVNRVHVLLWDIHTGQMVLTLRGAAPPSGDNGFNPRVAWSPDSRRLAASNSDTSFSIWDAGDRHSPVAKKAMQEAAMMRAVGQ
ncbi:MAG: serine/threonine-protein kinase [Gemmatales bacterium]